MNFEVYFHKGEEHLPMHDHSGKTTVVPRLCIKEATNSSKIPRILVCQPRRIACLKIAERVKKQLKMFKVSLFNPLFITKDSRYTAGHRIMNDIDDDNVNILVSHFIENLRNQFSTTGYLVQWLSKNDKILDNVTHVDLDLLALILKRKLLFNSSAFKLVVMSATLDVEIFGSYFSSVCYITSPSVILMEEEKDEIVLEFESLELNGLSKQKSKPTLKALPTTSNPVLSPPLVLHVGVKRFHVDHLFLEDIASASFEQFAGLFEANLDFGEKAAIYSVRQLKQFQSFTYSKAHSSQTVKPGIEDDGYLLGALLALHFGNIHFSHPEEEMDQNGNCVLIFFPGENEILEFIEKFETLIANHPSKSKINLVILHSHVPQNEQNLAFVPAEPGTLKIVLSTNLAESSVTISDVKFVIDFGLRRAMEYNVSRGIQQLTLGWISQASAIQRLGRCGRVAPGTCVSLFTRPFLSQRRRHELPEISQISLEGTILRCKDIFPGDKVRDILNELVEPPAPQQLDDAFRQLKMHGALVQVKESDDFEEGEITFFGRFASSLPVDLIQAKILLFAHGLGFAMEGCVLAAALTSLDIFSMPTPFFVKDKYELLSKMASSFAGRYHADNNNYSEPLALYTIFLQWIELPIKKRPAFFWDMAVNQQRFGQLRMLVATLAKRMADFISKEAVFRSGKADGDRSFVKKSALSLLAAGEFEQKEKEVYDERTKSIRDKLSLLCHEAGRSKSDGFILSKIKELGLSSDIDKLKTILLVACGSQLIVCDPTKTKSFSTFYNSANNALKELKKKKKQQKKKKKTKEELELSNSLFSSTGIDPKTKKAQNNLPVGIDESSLWKFRQLVPSVRDSKLRNIVPGLNPSKKKEEDTLSCSENIPDDQIYEAFDPLRTAIVKFNLQTPPSTKKASELRRLLEFFGVERIYSCRDFAAIEVTSVPKSTDANDGDDDILLIKDDISNSLKFLNYLTMGRERSPIVLPNAEFLNSAEVQLGQVIFSSCLKWKPQGFLVGNPPLKTFWRSPMNDIHPALSEEQLFGSVTSTLALSNGDRYYSVSISGITLFPIHQHVWKLRLLACLQVLNDTVITGTLVNPLTLRDISIGDLNMPFELPKQDMEFVNVCRRYLNSLLLFGDGFLEYRLATLLFDGLNEIVTNELSSMHMPLRVAGGLSQRVSISEDLGEEAKSGDGGFAFGVQADAEFSFDSRVSRFDTEPVGVVREDAFVPIFKPFKWPKWDPFVENDDDFTDSDEVESSDEDSSDY